MYNLPATPSARDIIRRSIVCHPSLFREALIKQADMHADYAELTSSPMAGASARSQLDTCLRLYDIVGSDQMDDDDKALFIVTDGVGSMVIVLNVAAKLQCLPPHIRTQAAVDYGEAHA